MEFDVYCDESRPDLFASTRNETGRFMLLGSVWFPSEQREVFKAEIKGLRRKHDAFGEIKWRAVAPSKLDFYLDLADWFAEKELASKTGIGGAKTIGRPAETTVAKRKKMTAGYGPAAQAIAGSKL